MKARRQERIGRPRRGMNLQMDDALFAYADQQAESLQVSRSRWIAHVIAQHGDIPGYEIDPPEDEDTKKETTSVAST